MIRDAVAAVSLFTRIPAWKVVKTEKSNYDNAVTFWPFAGWITGGVTAICIWLLTFALPVVVAVVVALIVRLLLTCALHEDGLADFCDGFGGGYDKEKILAIMKDSHIGTYGTIGLIIYFLLMVSVLSTLPPAVSACAILAADPFSKLCAGQLTNLLPYARPEGAKNKLTYRRMSAMRIVVMLIEGLIPVIPLVILNPKTVFALIFPICVLGLMTLYLRRKIGGYTGDCCGATFLICETAMLVAINAIANT